MLVRALARGLDIADDDGLPRLEDYHYPAPDEPHPVGVEALIRKIRQAQREAGATPVLPLVHGYGPLDDFRRRLEAGLGASPHGAWINRYGYLEDEKLDPDRPGPRSSPGRRSEPHPRVDRQAEEDQHQERHEHLRGLAQRPEPSRGPSPRPAPFARTGSPRSQRFRSSAIAWHEG